MVESLLKQTLDALRREWWVVLLVVAVGAGAGYVLASGEDVYTGAATIVVDTAPSSRYRGMPVVDDVVKEASSSSIREAVAGALGTDSSDVAARLRASASGNPLTRIRVTYSAPDEATAAAGAVSGADALISFVDRSVQTEIEIREQQIAASEAALAALGTGDVDTYERWQIETQLLDYQNALIGVKGVYTFDGNASTSVAKGSATRRNAALGGAVMGLAFGILLAGVREAGSYVQRSRKRR